MKTRGGDVGAGIKPGTEAFGGHAFLGVTPFLWIGVSGGVEGGGAVKDRST